MSWQVPLTLSLSHLLSSPVNSRGGHRSWGHAVAAKMYVLVHNNNYGEITTHYEMPGGTTDLTSHSALERKVFMLAPHPL